MFNSLYTCIIIGEVVFSGKFGILENASDICNSFNHNGEQLSNSTLQALCGSCGKLVYFFIFNWVKHIDYNLNAVDVLV